MASYVLGFASVILFVSISSGHQHGGSEGHHGGNGRHGIQGHGRHPQFQHQGFPGGQTPFLQSQFPNPFWNPFFENAGAGRRNEFQNRNKHHGPMNQNNPSANYGDQQPIPQNSFGSNQMTPGHNYNGFQQPNNGFQPHNNGNLQGNTNPQFGYQGPGSASRLPFPGAWPGMNGHYPQIGNGGGGYFPFQNQYPPSQLPGTFNNEPLPVPPGEKHPITALVPQEPTKTPEARPVEGFVAGETSPESGIQKSRPPPLPSTVHANPPTVTHQNPAPAPDPAVEKIPSLFPSPQPSDLPGTFSPAEVGPRPVPHKNSPSPVANPPGLVVQPASVPPKESITPKPPLTDTSGSKQVGGDDDEEDVDYKELLASLSTGSQDVDSDVDDWDNQGGDLPMTPLDIDARLNLKPKHRP